MEHTETDSGVITIRNHEHHDAAMVSDDLIVLMVKRSDTDGLRERLAVLADHALQHVTPAGNGDALEVSNG